MNLKEAINTFNGVMDLDHADKDMAEGNYREMVNAENGYTDKDENGNVINVPSDLLIGNPFLTLNIPHKTIGSYENKTGESNIYLVAEAFGAHGIYEWKKKVAGFANGRIEKIFKLDNAALYNTTTPNPFNFSFDSQYAVTGISLVNNILCWTDYLNRPRAFDIVRANETNKRRRFNIAFNKSNFATTSDYELDIYAPNTLVPVFSLVWSSSSPTYFSRNQDFINAYNTTPLASNYFSIINHIEYSAIEIVQLGAYVANFYENVSATPATNQSLCVPDNFYPDFDSGLPPAGVYPQVSFDLFTQDYIDFIKYVPLCAPEVQAGRDITKSGISLIANKVFQFCLQYEYKNYEASRLGAYSNIAVYNIDGSGNQVPTNDNYIDITFTDPRLENKGLVSMINKINLCVREGNEGQWRVFQVLNQYEFAGTGLQQVYRFFNDEGTVRLIPVIDEVEQYDAVPLLAKSLDVGDDRVFMGGNVDGYDTIPINANVDITYTANDADTDSFSIAGIIVIRNWNTFSAAQHYNQPIYDNNNYPLNIGWGGFPSTGSTAVQDTATQTFPDPDNIRGFLMFAAGTDYYAISTQNKLLSDGSVPSGIGGSLQFDAGGNAVFAADPNQIGLVTAYGISASDTVRENPFGLGIGALTSPANGAVTIGDSTGAGTGMFFSRFEIRNVKAGKYVLRMASPSEVTLELLNNGTKDYQTTSASLFSIGGSQGFEYVVTISDADAIINPLTGRKTVFVGVTEIADLTNHGGSNRQILGYLTDEYTAPSPTDYAEGLTHPRINYARVLSSDPVSPSLGFVPYSKYVALEGVSDHNGYFYFATNGAVNYTLDATAPVQVGTYTPTSPVLVMFDKAGGTFVDTTTDVIISVTVPFDAEISTNRRTHITGLVTDGNSDPLSGVNVVPLKCQWQHTDSNGIYAIVTYAETPNDGKEIEVLFQSGATNVSLSNAGNSYFLSSPVTIDLGSSDYNDVDNYALATVVFDILTSQESISAWKPGSDIQFGIVYYDEGGRRCAVITNDELRKHILFTNEKDENGIIQPSGQRVLSWQIFNEPHKDATTYQWVRTWNLQHGLYLWWAINKVEYVDDIDTSVGFTSPAATFAKLNFDNVPYYTINKFPGAIINFGFQVGDRIRVITGVTYIEAEIVKIIEPYFYVRKSNSFEFKSGTFVELFHPREQSDTNIYWEFSECYEVKWGTFAGVCKKYHAGQTQDQSFGTLPFAPVTPATGTFKSGNAWERQRRIPLGVTTATLTDPAIDGGQTIQTVYDGSVSDFYKSDDEDIGRPNTTELIGRTSKPTQICFGDRYLYGTKINGLCTFRALNQKTYNYEYGLMNKIILVRQEVLYMIFHNSYTLSVYLGKAVLRDLAGQLLVAISDDVMSKSENMQRTFGTQDPATVQLNDEGDVMWVDVSKGVAVRASGNGLTPISEYNMKGWWNGVCTQRAKRTTNNHLVGTYSILRDKYIMTLPLISQLSNVYPSVKVCMPDFEQNTVIIGYISTQPSTPLFTIPLIFSVWNGDTNDAIAWYLTSLGYTVVRLDCGCIKIIAPTMAAAGATLNIKSIGTDLLNPTDSACNTVGGWVAGSSWTNNGSAWRYGNVVGGNTSDLTLAITALKPNTDYTLQFNLTQAPTNTSFTLNVMMCGISIALYYPVGTVAASIPFNTGTMASNFLTFRGIQSASTTEYITIDAVHIIASTPVGNNYNYQFDNGVAADSETSPSYTIAFQKESIKNRVQGWKNFYEFYPEFYGKLQNDYIKFKDGDLWLAGAGVGYNNFFGLQFKRSITYVVNKDYEVTKGFKALSTFSRDTEDVPLIEIPPNVEYPNGMQSRLVKANFRIYNGENYSEILRDETDPTFTDPLDALFNGRPLQGESATITIENDSLEQSALKYCKTVYFYISKFPNL